jgi:hypothetical protein
VVEVKVFWFEVEVRVIFDEEEYVFVVFVVV